MTFDDQFKRAFDALSDRLHAEVQHQIDAALADVRAAVPTAVPSASPVEPPPRPVEPAPAPPADLTPVLETVRAMDDARSLTDILDALASGASRHGRGVAVRLKRGDRLETWRDIGLDGAFEAPDAYRLPLAIGGETIGELFVDGGSAETLEVLARHASRCLESMTAFKTARALAKHADQTTDEPLDEEDASAQRYAKLLVSEIKLYHESDVVAGRRNRDLAARLGGEIARARVLYDRRVPPHVRQRADYFHEELVRTLADGDPTLLEQHA